MTSAQEFHDLTTIAQGPKVFTKKHSVAYLMTP